MAKLKLTKTDADRLNAGPRQNIMDFDDRTLRNIDLCLLEGESINGISTKMKNEWGLYANASLKTVSRHLKQYAESELGKSRMEALKAAKEGVISKRFDRHIDPLKELEEVVEISKKRLMRVLEKENVPGGMLLQMVDKALDFHRKASVDLTTLQLQTGVIQKAPTRTVGIVTDADGRTTNFSWETTEEKLKRALDDDD